MTFKRKLLLCFVLGGNAIGIVGIYVLLELQIGISKVYVLSTFRDLMQNKVVSYDSEAMKRYHNGSIAQDDNWMSIPDYLSQGSVTSGLVVSIVAFICAINVVVLAAVLLKAGPTRRQTAEDATVRGAEM